MSEINHLPSAILPVTGAEFVVLDQAQGSNYVTVKSSLSSLGSALISFPISIQQGGTGATTAAQALINLGALPITGGTITGNLTVLGNTTLNHLTAGTTILGNTTVNDLTALGNTILGNTTVNDLTALGNTILGNTTVNDLTALGNTILGNTTVTNLTTLGTTTNTSVIHSQGPNAGLSFDDRDGVSPSWLWYALNGIVRLYNGADRFTIDGSGNTNITGTLNVGTEISAGGNLHGLSLFLGSQYILFNGNTSVSQGPFLSVNNTDWTSRLGATTGVWQFERGDGSIVASIDTAGIINCSLLRGGVGDGGSLKSIPTADPEVHIISFGWQGLDGTVSDQTLYFNIDGSRTSLIPWSATIKTLAVEADAGAPDGFHLAAFTGNFITYYFSDVSGDSRLRQGISDSEVDALAALCAVPVRRYEWLDEVQETFGVRQAPVEIGLVAQDLLPTMSDCVGISEGRPAPYPTDTHTIRHERLDAYFIRAIQQLTARVAALEVLK